MVIQFLALFVPARYFIDIVKGIFLKGIGLEILWFDLLLADRVYGAAMLLFRDQEAAAEGGVTV